MCGPSRPSSGGRIAVIFPSSSKSSSYSVFFHGLEESTRATFRIDDPVTSAAIRGCKSIDLRIERFGDLTSLNSPGMPLHTFSLNPNEGMEFELPKLDLGVSGEGIVGRQVTVSAGGGIGTGVVGFD